MGIGKRIREAREALNLTQKELGEIIGTTASSVTNYENDTSHPKEAIMYALINALKVDANYLFQDCVSTINTETLVTPWEKENLLPKYRCLDDYGKKNVITLLENEYQRCQAESASGTPDEEKALAAIAKLRQREKYRFMAHGTTPPADIELTPEELDKIEEKIIALRKKQNK